jgi:hexokinase
MEEPEIKALKFAESHGICPDFADAEKYISEFTREMEAGLAAEPSTLMMIPTYIIPRGGVPDGVPVAVLDAGGTNLRAAVVTFLHGEPHIDGFRTRRMPGTDGEVGADEFFDTLAEFVEPAVSKCGRLSFCFSYAAEPVPGGDCRVLMLTKQLNVKGIVGEMAGSRLAASLAKRGCTGVRFCVINDSAAVLMAGISSPEATPEGGCVGFILGTGTNTSYLEQCPRIAKNGISGLDGRMIINTESGGYGLFPQTDIDLELDSKNSDTGKYKYEKMVSGRYEGPLALLTLKKACGEGVFSQGFCGAVSSMDKLAASDIDAFLDSSSGALAPICSGGDAAALRVLLGALLDRAALFCAVNLTAAIERAGAGRDPQHPVCITVDGSVFRYSASFRSGLDRRLSALCRRRGITYKYFIPENSSMLGTAAAGLTVLD